MTNCKIIPNSKNCDCSENRFVKTSNCDNNQFCSNESSCSSTNPLGITIIPGSGELSEFPISIDDSQNSDDASIFLNCIRSSDICPRAYPPTNICIRDCQEFAAVSHFNFINGNLIISEPDLTLVPQQSAILQALPVCNKDLNDIFPNLIGVNGSIYIISTQYRKISGFARLRFVTGSIVIVNNDNLLSIPTFPNLLSVGGLVNSIPDTENIPTVGNACGCCHDNTINGKSAVIIANNPQLRKISGFEAVRQIRNGIFIVRNLCLTQICGFIHLYRTDRIIIKSNAKLNNVIGFCYIDTINISLIIVNNNYGGDYDFNLSGFNVLETSGNIIIINNNGLRDIKLDNLRTVLKYFIIRNNSHLETILSSVRTTGNLQIEKNRGLKNIDLQCLEEVIFSFNISGNCNLLCIKGFDELRRIGKGMIIAENQNLIEIKTFNKLKYTGSEYIEQLLLNSFNDESCNSCNTCEVDVKFDWKSIERLEDCIIIDPFNVCVYDNIECSCKYYLPSEFFRLICHTSVKCGGDNNSDDDNGPLSLIYSLIIYKNQRLKAIGGFENLKHVESNIYIIGNLILHTIQSFAKLGYALDIWIRNNPALKFIIGFSNLLSVRDLIVLESCNLIDFNSIKSLETAQTIYIEAKTSKTVKYPKKSILSVLGYTLYYNYDRD